MKAVIVPAYGSKAELSDIAKPALLDDSVMIEVYASSVNPVDNVIRAGHMKEMLALHLPYTVGNDVSGVVSEVGQNVRTFKVGDAVFSRPQSAQSGTFAEFVMVKEEDVARLKRQTPTIANRTGAPARHCSNGWEGNTAQLGAGCPEGTQRGGRAGRQVSCRRSWRPWPPCAPGRGPAASRQEWLGAAAAP